MKELMIAAGVPTPAFEAIPLSGNVGRNLRARGHAFAGEAGYFGGERRRVFALESQPRMDDIAALRDELSGAPMPPFCDSRLLFAERFIEGPEFTVFVMGNWRDPGSVRCLPPVERVFNASIPDGEKFLSYETVLGGVSRGDSASGWRCFL